MVVAFAVLAAAVVLSFGIFRFQLSRLLFDPLMLAALQAGV